MKINNRITEKDREKASKATEESEEKEEVFSKKKKKRHFIKNKYRGIIYKDSQEEENKGE